MNESILRTIKKLIGLTDDYTVFDADLILHINTFLSVITDFGIGDTDFSITGTDETWEDFLGSDEVFFNDVKTYLTGKVRLAFDPPTSSVVMQALKEQNNELEWRLIRRADCK